jgi:hypothetical protein
VPRGSGFEGEVAEPDLDGGDVDGSQVHELAFVVPGSHGAELFELVDRAFDGVSLPVTLGFEAGWPAVGRAAFTAVGLLVGLLRDGGLDATAAQVSADGKYADSLYGIHLGSEMPPAMFQGDRFWDLSGGQQTEDLPEATRARLVRRNNIYVSHVAAHLLDGQTLTHGLNDSPVGMLAWVLKRWRTWSDRNADFDANWPADDILTFATIYWVNQAVGSSIRAYKNASLYPPKPVNDLKPYVQAPAGFTFLLGDSSPGAESPEERVEIFKAGGGQFYADVRDINVHERGGHFGPYENPEAWIHDLRATYRKLR